MSLAAPGTNPASNLELKLPHTIGSANQLLKVDGSGQLGWADDNSGLSLSNDANNRVVTGTGSGLNAEANLTFDGTSFSLTGNANFHGQIRFEAGGTAWNTTYARPQIGRQADGELRIGAGSDSSSILTFYTSPSAGGTLAERLRINSSGNVQVNGGAVHVDANGELAVFESDTNLAFTNSGKLSFDYSGNIARIRSTHNGSGTTRNLGLYIANTLKILLTATQVKVNKEIIVGLQGGNDVTKIGGGSGIGAYVQLEHASSGINTKLMGNNDSYLNQFHGNLAIGEDDPDGNKLLIRAASTVGTKNGHIMLTGDSATVGQGPQIVFSESGPGSSYAGGYVGFVRQGGNSVGDLVFGTRNAQGDVNTIPTEQVRITSGGQLRITPSGSAKMSFYHDSNAGVNHITSNNGSEIKVSCGNGNSNGIEFWDYTGVNKRCQIDAEGIKFNADTATANGLNDYERGSYTPTCDAWGSFTVGFGYYVIIGDQVTAWGFIEDPSSTSSGSAVQIGLPVASSGNTFGQGGSGGIMTENVNLSGGNETVTYVLQGQAKMRLYHITDSGWNTVNGNHCGSTSGIYYSVTYYTS